MNWVDVRTRNVAFEIKYLSKNVKLHFRMNSFIVSCLEFYKVYKKKERKKELFNFIDGTLDTFFIRFYFTTSFHRIIQLERKRMKKKCLEFIEKLFWRALFHSTYWTFSSHTCASLCLRTTQTLCHWRGCTLCEIG